MALPNQKRAKSRKRVKQYRLRLNKTSLQKCPKCSKAILSHRACSFCGYYNNKEVIKIKTLKSKRAHEHAHEKNQKEQKDKHESKK